VAFLLHGKQKVRFFLSLQINDLKNKSLICAPVHLPVRAVRTQTGGRDDDFLRSHHVIPVGNPVTVHGCRFTVLKNMKARLLTDRYEEIMSAFFEDLEAWKKLCKKRLISELTPRLKMLQALYNSLKPLTVN